MEITLVDKLFEFNLWANNQLLEFCSQLNDDQLKVKSKGVVGDVQETFAHIVYAEAIYIRRLSGTTPWGDELDRDEWYNLSLAELQERAKISGHRLVELAAQVKLEKAHDVEWEGKQGVFFNWTVLVQALYHGIEHRTHIKILLTKLGVEHPEFSGWDFGAVWQKSDEEG